MPRSRSDAAVESTHPVRTAARLTRLSPEVLRAWERRYGVVRPLRTPGGTRRYRDSDLERLCLVKAAVDAGHRIGRIARLDAEELERLTAVAPSSSERPLDPILAALARLDAASSQRMLSEQLSALGPAHFARRIALPLLCEIGERWSDGRLGIAPEHLATGILRSLLGAALQPTAGSRLGPPIVFATPTGERHELGLLAAALTALGAGANPIYLGLELPVEELVAAVERASAAALALGIVAIPAAQAVRTLRAVRGGLDDSVRLWLGGSGARDLELPPGVEAIGSLEDLERRVVRLAIPGPRPR